MLTVACGTPAAALAQTAAHPSEAATETASNLLKSAGTAAANGQFVRAKNILVSLNDPTRAASLSDSERRRADQMLLNVSQRIKLLTPVVVSLQTAEESLLAGDLRLAQHHCQAVIDAPKATNEQVAQAKTVLEQVTTAQAQLAPQAQGKLDAGIAAFDAGDYALAKRELGDLHRSGVELTDSQSKLLAAYQAQVLDAARGTSGRVDAGLMQPGVVKRREPVQPAPASTPVEPMTPSEPAVQPSIPESVPSTPTPASQPDVMAPAPVQPAQIQPAPIQPVDPIAQAQMTELQAQMAEANAAFEGARYSEAIGRYNRILADFSSQLSTDQRALCDLRIRESRLRQGANAPDVLAGTLEARTVARQQASAEFRNYMTQAQQALDTGAADAARSHLASARLRVRSANNLFAQSELEAMDKELADMNAKIEKAAIEIEDRVRAEQARTQQIEADEAAREAASSRSRRIAEAIGRVRALQAERNYKEALQVTDEILFMDPTNPTGLLLRDALSDLEIFSRYSDIQRRKGYEHAQLKLDGQEASIPVAEVLAYPEDWPKISGRRGEPVAFADSEDNRRTLAVLESKKIPVKFTDQPLDSVLTFVKSVAGVDMDIDWASLDVVGVTKETPVTLELSRVNAKGVLDKVMERASQDPSNGAAWTIKDGAVFVASQEVVDRERVLAIYDIQDLLVVVPNFEDAPEFNLQTVLQGARGGGQSPFQDGNEEEEDLPTREERIDELVDIITTNVDPEGWEDASGNRGRIEQFQGNLVITQTPENHREIRGLLSKLRDQRSLQINVEARFLLVSQQFFEQIGFDLDVYWNGDNNQVRAARAAQPGAQIQPSDFFDFTRGGLQRRVGAPGADLDGDGTVEPPIQSPVALPSPLSVIGTPQNSLGLAETLTEGSFASTVLGQAPALGIGGQFLDDIQVDFLVKATQADRRSVSLTAPRLTFTNSQRAWVAVATQVAFVEDLQPVVSQSAVGFDPDLQVVSEGVVLDVDGVISADRRYVFMTVRTAVSRIEGFNNVSVTAIAGGQLVDSSDTQSFLQAPTVTVTEIKTSVTVPDQGTLLLGGQRLLTENEVETGVPVLSKIPILNRFFTNRTESKEEQTLLILMKPTVLIQAEEEEKNFPGLEETLKFNGR
jgi:type II secretory pathway component GspD/PulD (secretin)/tetratricopeptide (TPR) repeat protein